MIKQTFSYRPVGITMGCPAGVGPEIIVKAFARHNSQWSANQGAVVVIGSRRRLEEAAAILDIKVSFPEWRPGAIIETRKKGDVIIPVYDIHQDSCRDFRWGKPDAFTGAASMSYLETAIDLAIGCDIYAIVTAPLSKQGLRMAGIDFPGHTEILAERTDTTKYAMMLAGSSLRVVLVTIHCPLRDIASMLSVSRVLDTIRITNHSLKKRFGIENPSIMVAGLNPHAGEGGMFGNEEKLIIEPAIRKAEAEGIEVSGPWPPDTLFYSAVNGKVDAVVCMYHDQGLVPFKLLHFRDGVNITLGLPIIRTSVDHGTAYDIAGRGIALSESLEAAVNMAFELRK